MSTPSGRWFGRRVRKYVAEPVNRGRHVEPDALEQQLAGERGAVQLSQREHAQDGTTCWCGGW
jgi:hypothetical protein